jgi:hypothetical protein
MMKKVILFLFCFIVMPIVLKSDFISINESKDSNVSWQLENQERESAISIVKNFDPNSEIPLGSLINLNGEGTYKIITSLPGQWKVTYYVRIDNSFNITNVNRLSIELYKGSIKRNSFTHTKNQATCVFERKIGLLSFETTVNVKVSGKQLIIE